MEQIEFEESLKRIDDMMKLPVPNVRDRISEAEVTDKQPYYVNATVISVSIESDDDSPQILQSFFSEASNIAKAHDICKDIICVDNRFLFIYSTAYKEELNAALDDAARIRSLAMIVSKIGKQYNFGPIKINIGMDFGLVYMYLIGRDLLGSPKFAWRGAAIKNAQKNAEEANDELIISRSVWNNLSENNQKLFTRQSVVTDNYRGKVVNVMMNNWLTK